MPTSAAGSKPHPQSKGLNQRGQAPCDMPARARRRAAAPLASGFTLIELMVVVTLIAVATAGTVLSLRDSASTALERDAQRLAAVLESARARARASDAMVVWQARGQGFELHGLPAPQAPQAWLSPETRSRTTGPVLLGPEPLIPPQGIELYAASQPRQSLWVATDGLRPFAVVRQPAGNTP